MTPKEKAEELVDKYKEYTEDRYAESWSDAKSCALIAVDVMLSELEQLSKPEYTIFVTNFDLRKLKTMHGYEKKDYWQQVKEELNKL